MIIYEYRNGGNYMLILIGGFLIFIVLILVILVAWVITMYNRFVTLAERVANGQAQIAAQIESRWDAVKNLISATKQYSKHESEVLENITDKRNSLGENSSMGDIEENDSQLNNVVGRLIAISESYPDLKASEVYKTTMESVDKYENNVRHSRMIYNDTVTKFNRQLKQFPTNIVAKIFKFTEKEYFERTESKQDMPSWD